MFTWTADAGVADYYERGLFNGVLGTQNPENGLTMYFLPLAGGYWKTFATPLNSFWCCTGTGVENHAKYGDTIYFHDRDGVFKLEGFEKLRTDAAPAERAYADYLAGRLQPGDVALLPEPQRRVAQARAGAGAADAALRSVEDPLSRLIAAGVVFQASLASPETLQIAVDTASAQGWRRPLLAWLTVQLKRAEQAGDTTEAERLRRRIDVVQGKT